jgi:hypothetical protein
MITISFCSFLHPFSAVILYHELIEGAKEPLKK